MTLNDRLVARQGNGDRHAVDQRRVAIRRGRATPVEWDRCGGRTRRAVEFIKQILRREDADRDAIDSRLCRLGDRRRGEQVVVAFESRAKGLGDLAECVAFRSRQPKRLRRDMGLEA